MGCHFSLQELIHSATAERLGIDNRPDAPAVERIERLITALLDPMRTLWGASIRITSGYRSAELNRRVGGTARSQHLRGEAVDLSAGSTTANRQLFELIARSDLPFDQLIDERHYRWLHVSHAAHNRRETLHIP